ncbi:RNA-binding KH domain-containing protein RCF3 [Andrographis paniculata]|uniref:RNA-binding KH domain-containing protein RCF3 n=1 Tax=Andrographis paniculata TaxID=175694 RepID=UPI0021E90301|nr:RNA-binding KH domain-containing protein RCF3 [Andrographis paniculata]
MERSRSKRYYYDQDYESEPLHPRSKMRYGGGNSHGGGGVGGGHYYGSNYNRRSSTGGGGGGGGGGRKMPDQSLMVTTSYRILCHDAKAGGVIGKSGSIIKAIRQHTGAWINVHELVPGDEERIIEISDTRRRDPEGRMPSFSPAQEALFLIHERILESEMGAYGGYGEDEAEEYGNRGGGGGGGGRVVTRLVVSRMHVGCLLGKGGKIIEQMRMETKTHIRILPRDHTLPRCVAMSEEIVQVVGDMNAVKSAITNISSRLRESQHRDRSHFHNRIHSPDNFFPTDDDFHMNSTPRRSSVEGPSFGSRYSANHRGNNYSARSSGFGFESGPASEVDNAQLYSGEDLVFRMLCPAEKVDNVVGESSGIIDLLQNEIGVNVDISDPVNGSDEHIIIVSSEEGPDDELFPAQEALLHIQNRIVDLVPEKENIITTRLLLQADEVDSVVEMGKIGGVKVEILSREEIPAGISGTYEIVQITGEIKAAREALVEVTYRIRSYIYREFIEKETFVRQGSAPSHGDTPVEPESVSRNNTGPTVETHTGNGPVVSTPQSSASPAALQKVKDMEPPNVETPKQQESERREDQPSGLNRISVPLVTKSTLEVVIPSHAAAELAKKSRKLALISELSGAAVKLIDDRPEVTEKIIQISGTPEQAERAQSLLQGFILSTEEDGP